MTGNPARDNRSLPDTRFASDKHLTSWAGVCPANKQGGGKRLSGKTTKGNPYLRAILFEVAWAIAHTKDNYLSAFYHRMARCHGKKAAFLTAKALLAQRDFPRNLQVIYHRGHACEPMHGVIALFNATMILLQSIIEIAVGPMRDLTAQGLADGSWMGIVAIGVTRSGA